MSLRYSQSFPAAAVLLLLPLLQGCGDRGSEETPRPELRDLSEQLRRASAAGEISAEAGRALAAQLQQLLPSAIAMCPSCTGGLVYLEWDGGDHFALTLNRGESEEVALLELFYRPDLEPSSMADWGREEVGGMPASGFAGEHLFVWAGHFEIRVFARAEEVRSAPALRRLVGRLPLRDLARL